jgi:hypothetical protein
VYYATLTDGVVTKLASLNAEVLDYQLPPGGALPGSPILHYEEFGAEAGSTHCSVTPEVALTPCYAYVAAATAVPAVGADDLNYCFYTDTISAIEVINKFGAAATFGPTLVDLVVRRDGTIPVTAQALNVLSVNMSRGYGTFDGIPAILLPKVYADTHYFAVPAPPYTHDMNSGFSFTFPLQHFIGEKERISLLAIYDNDERTTTIGKFISPGLPTGVDAEEASLFFLTSSVPFVEGWLRFAPTATNGTVICTIGGASTDCYVLGLSPTTGGTVTTPGTTYVPAYTAATFVNGANELTASHFQYSANLTPPPTP